MTIYQNDDANLVMASDGPGTKLQTTHRMTGKTGNTITFDPPLPYALTAGLHPMANYVPLAGATLCGVENMTLNSSAGAANIVGFWQADRCWVKNVELYNAGNSFIQTYGSLQCEFRRCYAHHAYNSPNNSDGFGVYLWQRSTYCLVEDNIFTELGTGVLKSQASCNAILYNYIWKSTFYNGAFQNGVMNCNHGPHGMMDLFEGNMAEQFQNDGYHGSGSHETLFRNWFHGLHPTNTLNRKMIDLCRGSYYHNVVGNVLGDSSWHPSAYEMAGEQGYDYPVIYRLGYPNVMNNGYDAAVPWNGYGLVYPDAKVKSTLLRHGNFDYLNNATVWDPAISDHAIPASLFYSSKPSYFGSLQWPPIGPDVPGNVSDIPARARWNTYLASGNKSDLF